MERACVVYLQHENPGTHGVHAEPSITQRMRYATRQSATRTEYYTAMTAGLSPSYVIKLALAEEYDDEHQIKMDNKLYDVIRTYETEDGGIELTVQRRAD